MTLGNTFTAWKIQKRTSSYGVNHWLFKSWFDQPENVFQAESHITQPTLLPVAADASWELGYPLDADEAGTLDQFEDGPAFNMRVFCVPRHGSKASKVTTNEPWPKTEPLPGSINVVYFDGHVQLTPLEKLWQLHWHRNFTPRNRVP